MLSHTLAEFPVLVQSIVDMHAMDFLSEVVVFLLYLLGDNELSLEPATYFQSPRARRGRRERYRLTEKLNDNKYHINSKIAKVLRGKWISIA